MLTIDIIHWTSSSSTKWLLGNRSSYYWYSCTGSWMLVSVYHACKHISNNSSTDLQNTEASKTDTDRFHHAMAQFNAQWRSDRENVTSVHDDCVNADNSVLLQLSTVWSSTVSQPPQAPYLHWLATKSASENCWHLVAAEHFQSNLVHWGHRQSLDHAVVLGQWMSLVRRQVW